MDVTAAVALMSLAAGGFCFFQGMRTLKAKHLIENIPTSRIRSLAMGLVEVKGEVICLEPLTSPISGTKCVSYSYTVDEYVREDASSGTGITRQTDYVERWKNIRSGKKSTAFKIKDETGSLRVDPQGSRIDAPLSATYHEKRAGKGRGLMDVLADAIDKSINGPEEKLIKIRPGQSISDPKPSDLRYREYLILPGEELYVMGTAGNDGKETTIARGLNERFFYISRHSEKKISSRMGREAFMLMALGFIFTLTSFTLILAYLKII
ncbi:GIDE domain-containing protein [Candidatus Altiarchaeota archaeon]